MNKISKLLIFIIIFSLLLSGCASNEKFYGWDFSVIKLNYLDCEEYSYGGFRYTTYKYSEKNILKYKDNDNYFEITEDNVELVRHLIRCYEFNLDLYRNCDSTCEDNIIGNYSFDVSKDVCVGDYFHTELKVRSQMLDSVLPETQEYNHMHFNYVSLNSQTVYAFEIFDSLDRLVESWDELYDGEPLVDNNGCHRQIFTYKNATLLKDVADNIDVIDEYDIYGRKYPESLKDTVKGRDYYYQLNDVEIFNLNEICLEPESITTSYTYTSGEDYDSLKALVGYIKAGARDWSEDEFFAHYAEFFGYNYVSYFENNGRNFMRIRTGDYAYYFFMQDGDYIVELWNVDDIDNEINNPAASWLAVAKVYYR